VLLEKVKIGELKLNHIKRFTCTCTRFDNMRARAICE